MSINFTGLDGAVIIVYMLFMVGIGYYFSKKIKSNEDYYLGGRSFGSFAVVLTVLATAIGGNSLMGRAGIGYNSGLVAISIGLPYGIGMIFFAMTSKRIYETGVKYNFASVPDMIGYRFGLKTKHIFAAIIGYTMAAMISSSIIAFGVIFNLLGETIGITFELGAVIAVIIILIYTVTGGIYGVVWTDVVQGIMMLILMYLLLPVMTTIKAGGLSTMIASYP